MHYSAAGALVTRGIERTPDPAQRGAGSAIGRWTTTRENSAQVRLSF